MRSDPTLALGRGLLLQDVGVTLLVALALIVPPAGVIGEPIQRATPQDSRVELTPNLDLVGGAAIVADPVPDSRPTAGTATYRLSGSG